jgi:rubrerythrin
MTVVQEAKKIILFIVEGDTDEWALAGIMKRFLKNQRVYFQVVNTDITSAWTSTVTNIVEKIEEEIEKKKSEQKFYTTDILKIIHLIDIDGAYVSDEHIIQANTEHAVYTSEVIQTRHLEEMKKRNKRKSSILNKLEITSEIQGTPYCTYYFSTNLEHVLHDEQNVSKEKKQDYADQFADEYYDKVADFIAFISDSAFAVPGTYRETWEFIKNDVKSLNRHCNFHLFFAEQF